MLHLYKSSNGMLLFIDFGALIKRQCHGEKEKQFTAPLDQSNTGAALSGRQLTYMQQLRIFA
eukprot:scaffold26963_cov155-Skeletonema_dohrnii-CCMP3373.AAC.15